MVTPQGFNALLKIVEEPHALIVPQKLVQTCPSWSLLSHVRYETNLAPPQN
jgi:hypothetical protein